MSPMNFALRHLAPAAGATALAGWAGLTTINDDWDVTFTHPPPHHPTPTTQTHHLHHQTSQRKLSF